MNFENIANFVKANENKEATDVKTLDKKMQNRIAEVKKIYVKIDAIKGLISEKIKALDEEMKALERQTKVFEKEFMPVLMELEDHAIAAEGIFIELKAGRRSEKVGYEYLAQKVNSELLTAAENAIKSAAEFAKSPTIKVGSIQKQAGMLDWLRDQWNNLIGFLRGFKKQTDDVGNAIHELDKLTK